MTSEMNDAVLQHIISYLHPEYDYSTLFTQNTYVINERKRKNKCDIIRIQHILLEYFEEYFLLNNIDDLRRNISIPHIYNVINNMFFANYGPYFTRNNFFDKDHLFKLFEKLSDDICITHHTIRNKKNNNKLSSVNSKYGMHNKSHFIW